MDTANTSPLLSDLLHALVVQTRDVFSLGLAFVRQHYVAIFIAVFTFHLLSNKFGYGIHHIPGPRLAAYTYLWRVNDVVRGSAFKTAIALHKRHGPLVRIAPHVVSVGSADEIQTIYGTKTAFTKTAFYPIQCISWNKRPQMNLFSTTDPVYHRKQKKLVANAFAMSSLLEMESAVDSCSQLFMQNLHRMSATGAAIDLGTWMQYYAFDVVGEVCFAQKLGFLETGGDVDGMIRTIAGILLYSTDIGQMPTLHKLLLGNPIFPYILPSMENWNAVLTFTLKAVNNRGHLERNGNLEASYVNSDMMSKWTKVMQDFPDRMTTRDIIVHLSTNVFAGSDTTAIALRAIVYYLLKNPSKLEKLIAEIDDAGSRGLLSSPVSYKESVTHLVYLQAVIKEAIRMHPSVGLLLERHVPPEGAYICNTYIPGGTIVGINAWVLHYDEHSFPDPYRFLPERWIESSPEKLAQMNQAWFPFGAGSRTCIGKNISMMEIAKIIPQLLREFVVELSDPKAEWNVKGEWFVQQSGLFCNLTPRTQ
ncbi:cytochrome P450 [Kockiozyma suomiensis]|uniref:cytochrome P450 n=1 Tax=Kockiozyma suomiensis TaxID=1337062 RepID=UPI003343D4D8